MRVTQYKRRTKCKDTAMHLNTMCISTIIRIIKLFFFLLINYSCKFVFAVHFCEQTRIVIINDINNYLSITNWKNGECFVTCVNTHAYTYTSVRARVCGYGHLQSVRLVVAWKFCAAIFRCVCCFRIKMKYICVTL